MLNNDELQKILNAPTSILEIKDIHWRAQDSNSESILFYKIPNDDQGEKLFLDRLKATQFGWLIINRMIMNLPRNVTVIEEESWPDIQKKLLDKLYPMPNLIMMGITGTNGKTTTADLVLQIGHLIGKNGISIGTLGVREYNKTLVDFGLTSPSFIDFRKFITKYGKEKDFCVTEVSSHALIQDRLHGIIFDSAGWLSFSQDHLDYHKTMEDYYQAKSLIFKKIKSDKNLFVPMEQKQLVSQLTKTSSKTKVAPELEGNLPLFFRTQFNKNNLEVAKAMVECAFSQGINLDLEKLTPPDGRFYIQAFKSNYIIVDYAHTPDALENICRGIKKTFPGHKLKVLFGCGGDRDRMKRPLMASVVGNWADEIYVTSDNPRSEDPAQIISDVLFGLKDKKYQAIIDRPQAVKKAFSELTENEVLLLAGKGHEDYIIKNGIKHPYSDIREVDEFILRTKI